MNALIRVTLALAVSAVACPVFAADAPVKLGAESAAAHASAGAAVRAKLAAKGPRAAAANAGNGTTAVNTTVSGPRLANPFRAYPPSCAADPLPTEPTGPYYSADMPLYTRDDSGNSYTPEVVTIYIWRMACSSSGSLAPYNSDHGDNAITLMRIDRSSTDTQIFPTVPFITSNQGNFEGNLVRIAAEPNTVISEAPYDSAILFGTNIYVLENYPYNNSGYTFYNYDFDLLIDPVLDGACGGCTLFEIDGYVPTQGNYPAAFQNLPIDGYMSSAWYDSAHSGEGVLTEIYDNAGGTTRTIFAAWYTYDPNGIPFWLVAQGVFPIGANSIVNVPVYYYTGGGFAGDFGASTDSHVWGTMSFSFADCGQMTFSYNGQTDATTNGPSGSGTRTWVRIADINGLWCE
ncbi:MAG: hypothetical protein ACREPX_12795 [Rhodanobacteraceae bacterium]